LNIAEKRDFKKVGEKLVKIEVSFFGSKTLKGGNIRIKDGGLCFLLLFYLFHFLLFFGSNFLYLNLVKK